MAKDVTSATTLNPTNQADLNVLLCLPFVHANVHKQMYRYCP